MFDIRHARVSRRQTDARPRPRSAVPARPVQPTGCPCGGSCPRCTNRGEVLPQPLRTAMESRLGEPLGDVRVHADEDAGRAAAQADAHAFTIGNDIYFGSGRFAPHTAAGATRLAHELVHVVQQRAGRSGAWHTDARGAEHEARSLGVAVASGQQVSVRSSAPAAIQRDGPDEEGSLGPALSVPPGQFLKLDPEIERLLLQHYVRWWLGSAIVLGEAPDSVPAADSGEVSPDAPPPDDTATAAPGTGPVIAPWQVPGLPSLPLMPDFFAPIPPDPLYIEPDVGSLFGAFGQRGAPVGEGDHAVVFDIYRRNAAIASGLPDFRGMAPGFLRPLIPLTWRRDIAGALTGAAVGAHLNHDYMTPIEISDRAWQGMTGASTTVIPFPSISFDLFGGGK